jgi:hypothetical protein
MFFFTHGNLKGVQSQEKKSSIYICVYESQLMGCEDRTASLKPLMLMHILCIQLHETIYCQNSMCHSELLHGFSGLESHHR